MTGDFTTPRHSGTPGSGPEEASAVPSPALELEREEPAFWANSKRTARAQHAARSRHPDSWYGSPGRSARGQVDSPPDPVEEFARAMDDYRRASGRMFPTWCEVLEVLRSLGYSRLASPSPVDHTDLLDPLGFATKGGT